MDDKVMSDAIAYIRGLAKLRGRNAAWAEKAVAEAASLSAAEALAQDVVDLLADDVADLLDKAEGRTVMLKGVKHTLHTRGTRVVAVEPDWRTEFLATITNPTVAYILLLVGIYGLVFEFWNPGFTGPGVIGGICLVLGLFAMHLLPVNYAGLGLIALGIAFMVAETFVPAFGILGIGGVVAFVVGSIMLMDTDVPGFGISWPVIATVGGASASLFMIGMVLLARARKRPVVSGMEEMIGLTGEVIAWSGTTGTVRTHGEVWRASSAGPLHAGQRVKVTDMDGLVLTVTATDKPEKE
jgi:membrane-bound serine protease (ClpP class)